MNQQTSNTNRDYFGLVLASVASVSICYVLLSLHGYFEDPLVIHRHSFPSRTLEIPGWPLRAFVSLLGVALVPVFMVGYRMVAGWVRPEVNRWRKLADNVEDIHEWTQPPASVPRPEPKGDKKP